MRYPAARCEVSEDRNGMIMPPHPTLYREKEAVAPPMTDTGTKVLVKGFRFTGNEGIAMEAELKELIKDSTGKELDFADLQHIASRVTAYLRQLCHKLCKRGPHHWRQLLGIHGVCELRIYVHPEHVERHRHIDERTEHNGRHAGGPERLSGNTRYTVHGPRSRRHHPDKLY